MKSQSGASEYFFNVWEAYGEAADVLWKGLSPNLQKLLMNQILSDVYSEDDEVRMLLQGIENVLTDLVGTPNIRKYILSKRNPQE